MKKQPLVAVLWLAALAALAVPAMADVQPYNRSGKWTNVAGIGNAGNHQAPMCGMASTGENLGEWRYGSIKFSDGSLYVQIATGRWRFRKSTNVRVQIGFDRQPWIGGSSAYGDGESIFITIAPEHVEGFLREVGEADVMWFQLGSNEWNWAFDMTGSRNAMNSLRECMGKIAAPPPPVAQAPIPAPTPTPAAPGQQQAGLPTASYSVVPIIVTNGGTIVQVDVLMGGQPIRMTLDTGATHCTVTEAVATNIVNSGRGVWGESLTSELADGSRHTARSVLVREMRIGSHIVRNVQAVVSSSSDMLLGFPALNAIGPFTIDTRGGELIFHHRSAS